MEVRAIKQNRDAVDEVNQSVNVNATNLRRVTCDNSLKTRTAQLSARGTFHGSHVYTNTTHKKTSENKHAVLKL